MFSDVYNINYSIRSVAAFSTCYTISIIVFCIYNIKIRDVIYLIK